MHYILVHGICHGGWCWEKTRLDLEQLGHSVSAPDLPLTSLADDANAVVAILDKTAGPSILVGHSYGGSVISLAANERSDIRHLVYVAAIMLGEGDSFMDLAKHHPSELNQHMVFAADNTITMTDEGARACFYNCCDPDTAARAVSRLRPTSVECLKPQPIVEPWASIPSTYVLCSKDNAIVAGLQSVMAQRAAQTVVIDTDHSPFYSSQGELTTILGSL